jgi:hypothetical protein
MPDQAPNIEEMILMERVRAELDRAEKTLSQEGYIPTQPGYGLGGHPILFGLKYQLDSDDLSQNQVSFAYAEGEVFHAIPATVSFSGWGELGLPAITVSGVDSYAGDLEGLSLHNQCLAHIEATLSQLGMILMHVHQGKLPKNALTMPSQEPSPASGIILP